ncbi:MAG: ATP-binding protein [Cyanobacteria bacterium J06623_5]
MLTTPQTVPNTVDGARFTRQAEEISDLKEQVATLEELLQLYEESAVAQEQQLQSTLKTLEERAQQLEHAQETLQTLKCILDSMGDAVIVVDTEGRGLFINPAAKQLLKTETINESFRDWGKHHRFFCGDGTTPYALEARPLVRALRGDAVETEEMRVVSQANEKDCWLSVNAKPIVPAPTSKTTTGAVAVFRDISSRKQFEQELKASNIAAQQQAQILESTLQELRHTQSQLIHGEKMASLGKTVAGIAHEINNPVNFIHGNLRHTKLAFSDLLALVQLFQATYSPLTPALEDKLEDIDLEFLAEDIPDMLSSMANGTTRIQKIVQSLRVFSRLDEAKTKAVDIHQGLDSALLMVRSQLSATATRPAIHICKCYDSSLPPLHCHAGELNQVFANLLSNAVDALTQQIKSPEITLSTKLTTQSDKTAIAIEIADNGSGIPAEIQPKIFDPFFTTKPIGKGTGLGLSTAYQIVTELHRGSLTCTSKLGQGTCIRIALPCES